jgi:hypothetical protein
LKQLRKTDESEIGVTSKEEAVLGLANSFGFRFELGGVTASKVQSSKSTAEPRSINIEEKIPSLFEPDTLVSAEYFQNFRRKTLLEPEKRLMLAMLEDAVNCFQVYATARSGRGKKLFNEAEEWIMMKHDDWIFSFVSVCEMLGFNAEYVRQGLRQWKEKTVANHTTPEYWRKKRLAG